MGSRLPLSGGSKMIPTREDLERLPWSFFAQSRRGRVRSNLTWLIRDEMTTPDDAPVGSPRTCEPGPGTITLVQTDGTQAISGGKHVFTAQSTPAWGDQGFYSTVQTRAAGLALVLTLNLSTWEECGIGWHTAGAVVDPDSMEHSIQANATNGQLDTENATPIANDLSADTDYKLLLILRDDGCFYILDGNLLWVEDAGATASLYPSFSNLDGAGSNDDLGVIDLPDEGYAQWSTVFGAATGRITAPDEEDTAAHQADCVVYMRDVTLPSAGVLQYEFRETP